MARLPDKENLYKAFQEFLNLCVISDRSILWPNRNIWTRANVAEVKKRMVETPILGANLSFEKKLQEQMKDSSPELWAIVSDLYYVYFLPSAHITYERKRKDINWAADQGGLVPSPSNDEIWEALKLGFTRTTQKYHFKYAQFWLLLLFVNHIKEHPESSALITNPRELQNLLDSILDQIPNKLDRAYDMRHAILYMAFPDSYERIISTRDKERILERYRNVIAGSIPLDIDDAIRSIRNVLSKQYDKPERAFDFYKDLSQQWKPPKSKPVRPPVIETENGVVTVPEEVVSEVQQTEPEVTEHTKVQWMLLKLGNDMGLDVWVASNDRNREIDGHKFTDLPRMKKEIPLTFDEASNRTIRLIDVVWLKGNVIKAAFEIESTTSIYSGILRLADLIAMQPNINIPLYLVAPEGRREKVIQEINRPVFSKLPLPMSQICRFISFSTLYEKIPKISSMVKYLSPDFLDELSESCEADSEE